MEFGLIQDLRLDLLLRLSLGVVLGGAIGFERELQRKAAGLRTNILICVGAVLFTELSMAMSSASGDPARIAAQIVTGVGFLGAGTIIQGRGIVTGLTTAATMWLVAAIGMAIGFGALLEATGATLLVLLVLSLLRPIERVIARRSQKSGGVE
jgi:putative Mg2+ transporter-C (MgtC) family protein